MKKNCSESAQLSNNLALVDLDKLFGKSIPYVVNQQVVDELVHVISQMVKDGRDVIFHTSNTKSSREYITSTIDEWCGDVLDKIYVLVTEQDEPQSVTDDRRNEMLRLWNENGKDVIHISSKIHYNNLKGSEPQ